MLRRILAVTCLLVALAASAERIAQVECISYPGRDPGVWNGLFAAQDGKVYTGLCTHSGSAHFYRYDPATGENENLYDIAEFLGERRRGIRTSGKIHTPIVSDGKGGLYFGTLNNLIDTCDFDPDRPNVSLDIACWLAELLPGRRYNRFIERKFSQIQKTEGYNNGETKSV